MDRRLNITMPPELVSAVDAHARSGHYSRSGVIREALKAWLRTEGVELEPAPAPARGRAESGPARSEVPVEILVDRLRAFCAGQDGIVAAYLFGSKATGLAGPLSDVDVALLLDRCSAGIRGSMSPDGGADSRLAELTSRLPVALRVPRVDVVILNTAPSALAFAVVRDGLIAVGAGDPRRIRFEVGVFQRYLDYLPLERTYNKALRDRILGGELVAR
ncbi:MAG: ribbon-helix-helix protein, CopG family [Actinobacteria bacterium]|nr:ribbon-helix-helix protein, CopG family [Actinomycetota bacterium]